MSCAARREGWLDGLRILAAFLVIVNHTNSYVFKAASPGQAEWWLSIALYYLSKIAVPLFVMISGACLLPKRDGWRTAGRRALRVLLVLLLFSYGYYAYDAWINWGLWPRLANLALSEPGLDAADYRSFWYLYFYLGLMAMLPFLQRLAQALRARELLGLLGACFFLDGLWPLIAHYAPGLGGALLLSGSAVYRLYWPGSFAGYWIRGLKVPSRGQMLGAGLALAAWPRGERRAHPHRIRPVAPGEKYWFMDDRMHPALPTVLAAVCMLLLFRGWLSRPSSPRACGAGRAAPLVYTWYRIG